MLIQLNFKFFFLNLKRFIWKNVLAKVPQQHTKVSALKYAHYQQNYNVLYCFPNFFAP